MDTLIALLAVHGPSTADRLARRGGTWRWLTARRLHALWLDDLVSVDAGKLWKLTARGHARAGVLRLDEPRFARLVRTR